MAGAINFVSDGYPGSYSDKEITKDCKVLEQLTVGDSLMADKGFLIHDLLPDGKS